MIISRYISKEIIVNICWVSLVLFGLVLLSRFNIFLSQAEVGKISAENILFALVLFSPGLINLVFPISVFLALGFVLTPIFKNHDTVLTAGSMTIGRLLFSQKYVIFAIFSDATLTSLSFFQLENLGYPTADIITTIVITTKSSNNVNPLMS